MEFLTEDKIISIINIFDSVGKLKRTMGKEKAHMERRRGYGMVNGESAALWE